MTTRRRLLFLFIQFNRYILKRKFIPIFSGSLKGYLWSTSYNYGYLLDEYEDRKVLDTFSSWLKEDSVVYDLGANVGYYAFIANLRITQGRIYSFEPLPVNIDIFKKHLELNRVRMKHHRISIEPYAVSDKEGEVFFSNSADSIEGNTYVDSIDRNVAVKELAVKCYSIDGLVESGYKKPDVIKIDVEGAEFDVLKGAEKTLEKYKPNILLATHDCHLPGVQEKCVRFLEDAGYHVNALPAFNKHMDGLNDFIAIHRENL